MLDVLSDHPAVGYSLAGTKTWYPNQEIELLKDGEVEFSIDGHNFAGAELDEENWKLTVFSTMGEETTIDLDGRKSKLDTLDETIEFMRRKDIEIPYDSADYRSLQIFDDELLYADPEDVSKGYTISKTEFVNARIDYDANKISITLNVPPYSIVCPFKEV